MRSLLLLMLLATAPVAAQCTGDANMNGRVTIDEVVQAVNNLLAGGCYLEQPERCPYGLDDAPAASPFCVWIGTYNPECGARIMLTLTGRNTLAVGQTPFQPFGFTIVANPDGSLRDAHYNAGYELPLTGTAYIDEAGGLVVDAPIADIIPGCPFRRFEGVFNGVVPAHY